MKTRFRHVAMTCMCVSFLFPISGRAANQFTESFTTTTYKDAVNTTADWNASLGQLRLFPFAPALVGGYDTPGLARDVAVAGDLAFVADWTEGLRIINIANPASPMLTGAFDTPSYATAVAVSGNLALVTDLDFGLYLINITNPASPTLLGSYNTPGLARDVAVAGDLAFLADGAAGLQIINIINPASPTLVGTYNTPGNAWDVDVAGNLALLADLSGGLQIISIANPASPALVTAYDAPGSERGVAVAGNCAFVAAELAGLQVVSIANPAVPTLVGGLDTPGNALGVRVVGGQAFVADNDFGLQVIDISNPATPVLIDTYNTPGFAEKVAVAGDLAFVADETSGLQIIKTGVPLLSPVWRSIRYGSGSVAVDGDLAFVANWNDALEIINIANPASPTLVGSCDTPGNPFDVAVAGDLAFVADYGAGLQIIDISNPASPTLAGGYDTPRYANGVAVSGNLALVTDQDFGLYLINITNPASPTLLANYVTGDFAEYLAVAGDLAFVANGNSGLRIIDISNPASPTLAGSYNTPGYAVRVAVAGDLAFVADYGAGLQIIDITNPASPTLAGSYDTPGSAVCVAMAGDLAFVADGTSGLQIIDITNPATPTLFTTYETLDDAWRVTVAGDLAFVADSNWFTLLQVFQREVDSMRNAGRSLTVAATAEPIYRAGLATTQTAGVTWEVSADAGTSWQAITPGSTASILAVRGSDLRWRSTHAWAPGVNPTAYDLQLTWLYDGAVIDGITDIANDQGRQVRVEWTRSGHDFIGDLSQIVEYAVYRKIDPGLSAATAAAPEPAQLSPAARENALMMMAAGWDFVTTVPVRVEDSYAVVVPTLGDSTIAQGQYWSTFRVTALTATPGVFFDSPTDSGYSVDNLAPSVPGNFAVAYNTGSGNTLSWQDSPDSDFRYFRVHRSSDPNFTPSPGTLVHETVTNGWVDPDYDGWSVYYKVTATDFSGNESAPASAGTMTGVGGPAPPKTFALYPNAPNPFNPTTLIRYDVPEGGGNVSLRIYDVSGRLVKTLWDGKQTAGQKSATWDGRDETGRPVVSGVYFCRLTAPGFVESRKMVLTK